MSFNAIVYKRKKNKVTNIRKMFLSNQTARYQNTKRLNLNIKIISAVGHLENHITLFGGL